MSLWRVLEQSLRAHGQQPALTRPDGSCMDYAGLLERVEALSAKLGAFIPAGSRVAVVDEHPFEEAIQVLALIALEVTVIPLAYKYGEQRCIQIIEHTRPDFLCSSTSSLVSEAILEACRTTGTVPVIGAELQSGAPQGAGGSDGLPAEMPASFIMYTSGSTGKPKGAVLTHANILANIEDIRTYFEVGPGDHVLINRSLSHASVMTGEFLYGLIYGARVTFYTEAFVPRRLLSFMETNGVTIFCSTPTIFYQMALDRSDYRVPSLRKVALMGEYLHKQVSLKISERFSHVEFFMLYGQTEASPRITYLPSRYFTEKESCIGMTLPSMEFRIIDENGRDVEPGEPGELLVRGPNIFWGYWDQPELTAVKLRDGWLHTGDMVAQGEGRFLYISGRKDDMIIRAGMNIYPREVEDVLLADERVREAIVFGVADPKYGQKLHVCAVPYVEGGLTPADVLDICKKKLATYQYPDAVDIVQQIPRNAAGKIMRRQVTV
ncbi:acyl--CoA ligase [Paenibacillus athensensis]|uniref:Long-chain fatty acid--CoA ligase n=1 Tax=Paenibacillus athensensis TaxID=1967502 RepID=A0A4Y8Q3J0_9BACL|nr:class I adenylate-forming enzyme family protein [Paenibacillus athensensis]MCD1258650.1 acyl--CoA ligase [Paenibacillus athensensis]